MPDRTNIKIEAPGVSCAVVKKDYDGWKFLLLQRSESETYGGTWGFVTGSKRSTETVAQVVTREIKEETGMAPSSIWATEHTIQFYEPEEDTIWVLPTIVAVVPEDAEVTLNPENCAYRWTTPHKARHMVTWKNLITSIDLIVDELEIFPAKNWVEIKP
ncbi:MAG TPA: NUDIX domain-containing protein [candidate division Zixibacteria bacterium]|nr:NUDIX domain-containing protein [candidate division Zixibacteria bacterium]